MKKFILTSLLAAGFSLNATAQNKDSIIDFDTNDRVDLNNNTMGIESIIEKNMPFTLAAHSSHRSHGSHRSHISHRSSSHSSHSSSSHYSSFHTSHASHSSHYSHYSYGSGSNYDDQYRDQGLGRNLNSTPNESILPRSPAIVDVNKMEMENNMMSMSKDMKTLEKEKIKGKSKKFIILTHRAQLALYGMGYYSGTIDGIFNSELISSISKFQNKYNMKVTGSLSDELVAYLNIGEEIEKN